MFWFGGGEGGRIRGGGRMRGGGGRMRGGGRRMREGGGGGSRIAWTILYRQKLDLL